MNVLVNDQLRPEELYEQIVSASNVSEIKSLRAHLEMFTQRVKKGETTPGYNADLIDQIWKVLQPKEAELKDEAGHFVIVKMEFKRKLNELEKDLESMKDDESLPEIGTDARFKVFTDRMKRFRDSVNKAKPYHVQYDWAPYKELRSKYEPYFKEEVQTQYRAYVG